MRLAAFILLLSLAVSEAGDRFTDAYRVKVLQGSGVAIRGVGAQKAAKLITAANINATWSNVRIYFLRNSQNAGTGSVVYTAGGWSSVNATLVGSPTWGETGIDFNGTSQYCVDDSDVWGGGTALTAFADFNQDTLTNAQVLFGVYGFSAPANQRSFQVDIPAGGASYRFVSTPDGSTVTFSSFGTPAASTQQSMSLIYAASSLAAYLNNGSETVTTTPPASLFNAATVVSLACNNAGGPASFFDGKIGCVILVKQTLSTAAALRINAAMEGLR